MSTQPLSICATFAKDDCSIEVPEELNMVPPELEATMYGMLALNIVIICVCGVWLYIQRESPQVKASQPFFLLLVLLGCLVSSSTILALAQEDHGDGSVPACMVR